MGIGAVTFVFHLSKCMLCKFRLQLVVTVKLIGDKGKLTEDSDRGMASEGWGASPYFRQG